MNCDVVVLALASAPRPAGIAALYALLSASHPRRALVAYLVAGLTSAWLSGFRRGDLLLSARHAEIPASDDMPAELKFVLARQMKIYAGFLEWSSGRARDEQ